MAFVSQDATQRDAKASLALARHAFTLPEMEGARDTHVIVPDEPIYGRRVHFTAMGRDGLSLFVCSCCDTAVYGVPFAFQPHPWDQKIQVWNEGTTDPARSHHEVIRDGTYRLALRIFPDTCSFRVASSMRAEGATRFTTIDRLRNAIKTAAKQLKRGTAVRPGPSVIFVYHSGILVAEERELFSALFGDLQYSFLPGQFQLGNHPGQFFGRNVIAVERNLCRHPPAMSAAIKLGHCRLWPHRPAQAGQIGASNHRAATTHRHQHHALA